MRIAYLLLHDFRFSSTGPEEFAYRQFHFSKEYARRMAALGHDVTLYVLSHLEPKRQVVEIDGYTIKTFRSAFYLPPFLRFGNSHSPMAVRDAIESSPDVIHHHNYYLWNFPYVSLKSKRGKAGLVAQFHGTDPLRSLKGMCFYPALRRADRLLAPTRGEYNFLSSTLRLSRLKVLSAPSTGVDTGRFRKSGNQVPGQLLYVGRIPSNPSYIWEKSPQLLLPLLAGLRRLRVDSRLMVAGDGPGLEDMRRRAGRLGLSDHVDFLGRVSQDRLPELYSQSILTFAPIQMDEIEPFWGGTVQESLACQTPVAAFSQDTPGVRKFGCLVEPGEAGARTLAPLLRDDRALASAGRLGAEFVRSNCDWGVVIKRLEAVYGEVMGVTPG